MEIHGKKTYLVSVIAILSAVSAYVSGEMNLGEAINAAVMALGLATLRHGVSKNAH